MVRLLFDENLSHRLVTELSDLFPDSVHVRSVGLSTATDQDVWNYAQESGLVIVSKDGDFHEMSFLYGPPPNLVWLRVVLMRSKAGNIERFAREDEEALLIVKP